MRIRKTAIQYYMAALIVFVVSAAQAEFIVISNRNPDQQVTPALCQKFQNLGIVIDGHCTIADNKVVEFGDGSTFTQIHHNLYGEDVLVIMPRISDGPDHFMEGLLKIRTAKNLGARKIYVFSPHKLSDFEMSLIQKSGAHVLLRLNSTKDEVTFAPEWDGAHTYSEQKFKVTHEPSLQNAHVFSSGKSSFAKALSHRLGIQHITKKNEMKNILEETSLKRGQTIILVSQWSMVNGNKKLLSDLKFIFDIQMDAERRGTMVPHIIYVAPYLPYARGDKVDHIGTTVSGKLIADLIEVVSPNLIAFARLHAAQSQGFFNIPSVHVTGRPTITQQLAGLDLHAIISPDAGFQKEASRYADDLKLPVFVLNKQRDLLTGESHLKSIGDIDLKGQRVAIIDDETASGGTLSKAAEYLKSQGASKVYAVVTHLTGVADKAVGSPAIDKIFVTNTIDTKIKHESKSKLEVLDLSGEFSEELQRFLGLAPVQNCRQYLEPK